MSRKSIARKPALRR